MIARTIGSSSTTSTVSLPPVPPPAAGSAGASGSSASGSSTRIVVPSPGMLSATTYPWLCFTMP